jgi:hypothetical protein
MKKQFSTGFNLNTLLSLNKIFYWFILLALIITIHSCKDDPVKPSDPAKKIILSTDKLSCTEAWINIRSENLNFPYNAIIKIDSTVKLIPINNSDTVIYIDLLLPKRDYEMEVSSFQDSITSLFKFTTLDTTTHNFTINTLEIESDHCTSYLEDAWIFDENNIWVSGDICDLNKPEHNFLQWNGTEWVGRGFFTSTGVHSIYAFDSSNIFFATGAIMTYKDSVFTQVSLGHLGFTTGQAVEKLWGLNEQKIWGVGKWGLIVHFDGTNWTRIPFDEYWIFQDVTGNKETGVAYAVARRNNNCIVVEIRENSASIIYERKVLSNPTGETIIEVDGKLWLTGSDLSSTYVWTLDETTKEFKIIHEISPTIHLSQSWCVANNDIYFAGNDYGIGRLLHYNGYTFSLQEMGVDYDSRGAIHAIKDLAVSVGFKDYKAIIKTIKRN